MEIKTAEFSISSPMVSMCPKDTKLEYAFIGRSNVGKSSLINMLCRNKKLAKTSATPGKTLLINHFIINKEWYLVDLPGYGYAKRSKKEVQRLDQMIRGYILGREQLVNVFVLIDVRLEAQTIDLEFMNWLGMSGIPFSMVFTKADKLSAAKVRASVEAYEQTRQRKERVGKSCSTTLRKSTRSWDISGKGNSIPRRAEPYEIVWFSSFI